MKHRLERVRELIKRELSVIVAREFNFGATLVTIQFADISDALRSHQRFVVMSHVRPDGDALGSQLALALSLREMGKDVKAWNEDGVAEKFAFLPGAEMIARPPAKPEPFEVAIALDTA